MKAENEERVLRKLDQIARLLAISVTRGLDKPEQVLILQQSGFEVREIASALGSSPNAVSVMLYKLRKKPRKVLSEGK